MPSAFAVAPPVWLAGEPFDAELLQGELRDALSGEGRKVEALSEAPTPECAEDIACLTRLGEERGFDTLVVTRLARLGPTTLLRLQSVDVGLGAMDHTIQSVIEDTDDARLARSLRDTAQRFARLYAPAPPWYRRPMVIAAGVVGVAAVLTTVLLLTRDSEPEPRTVTPP